MRQKIVSLIDDTLDGVVVMGDLLHRHEKVNSVVLCKAVSFLRAIRDALKDSSNLYLIIGNHDRPNNSDFLTDLHPFTAIKGWDRTVIVDSTMKVCINETSFLLVPYVYPGRFFEAIAKVETPLDVAAVLCHQEFYGCKMGAIKSTVGDKWPTDYPLVISGHIHDYQVPQRNMIYIGTPVQHGFGGATGKTVSIFQFRNDIYEEERVSLGLRGKKTIYLNWEGVQSYTHVDENNDVRVVFKGTKDQINSLIKGGHDLRLKNLGVKLACKEVTVDGPVNIASSSLTFIQRLNQEVVGISEEEKWVRLLFHNY